METTKKLHHLLTEAMASDNAATEAPGLENMAGARAAVLARKKNVQEHKPLLTAVFSLLNFNLKFYHLGISILLTMFATFYFTESHYSVAGVAGFSEHSSNTLSIKSSTTISVNSSTMLTSIPTLRN